MDVLHVASKLTINETIQLDLSENEVRHLDSGVVYYLGSNEIKLLKFLIANQDQVLSRSVLLEEVWGAKGVQVEDGSLMQAVSSCRKALLDKKGQIIVTERGRGYRLSAEVSVGTGGDEVYSSTLRKGIILMCLAVYISSAVVSFLMYKMWSSYRISPIVNLQQSFSRCQVVSEEGDLLYEFKNGVQYSTAELILLVGETGESMSLPVNLEGLSCEK